MYDPGETGGFMWVIRCDRIKEINQWREGRGYQLVLIPAWLPRRRTELRAGKIQLPLYLALWTTYFKSLTTLTFVQRYEGWSFLQRLKDVFGTIKRRWRRRSNGNLTVVPKSKCLRRLILGQPQAHFILFNNYQRPPASGEGIVTGKYQGNSASIIAHPFCG